MSSLITSLASSITQPIFSAIQSTFSPNQNENNLSGVASSSAPRRDSSQLSPFAQLLSTLPQLQQSDPTKYSQVTQQISTNLQTAAQTAQSEGNTTVASQLNQLATDFSAASKSGQLPSVQDLASAIGGHHHHHHAKAAALDSDGSSGATALNTIVNTLNGASTTASAPSTAQQ